MPGLKDLQPENLSKIADALDEVNAVLMTKYVALTTNYDRQCLYVVAVLRGG